MSATEIFIKRFQEETGKDPFPEKFWAAYPEKTTHTFQDALDKYAQYYQTLGAEQQKRMSKLFWGIIKTLGTPIIEDNLSADNTCSVYFLFPKDKIADSLEKSENKRHLYLQGDFHGYSAIDGRQELSELADTRIMWHKDSMPKNAIVVYSYIQVEPSQAGIKPKPERSPFFNHGEGFTPRKTSDAEFPTIQKSICNDDNSTHIFPYPGFDFGNGEKIFRVSADAKYAHISGERVDWSNLLSEKTQSKSKHFIYHATFYSDKKGDLHHSKTPVTNQYHDDLNFSDQTNSPYANFTRSIQVFKPASGKINNVIVINDGIPYLIAGAMDRFEKMASENELFHNTTLVFINILPGLKSTLPQKEAEAYNKDPSVNLPGMGVRLVDYKHGLDQYSEFIANKLLPELKNEIDIPDDPRHRIMIGSSMSGTASLYIGLKHPDLFGAVIVQSPSPDNREKLSEISKEMLINRKTHIHLSCGAFEHPDYAAANDNIGYAAELSSKLGIPLHVVAHGHQFVPWTVELEQSLPFTLNMLQTQSLMQTGYVPGVSIATISQGEIQSAVLGCADAQSKSMVKSETQFWACSLSKPVFAYLVLRLIKNELLPPNFLDEALPWNEKQFGPQGDKKPFTPRMILSHQTGLSNEQPINFKFNPDEGFRYSGEGYIYLQTIIEEMTKKNLEQLAQENLFGSKALNMTRTTFLAPEEKTKAKTHDEAMVPYQLPELPTNANDGNASGSLQTTASDYARFLMACMKDKDFIELITPQIHSMENDIDAKDKKLDSETLKPINWGLGFGLQKNEDGKVIAAFHWGHGPGARTFFAINLEHPSSAVVYFTNSENGLAIAKDIAAATVGDITPIMKFLSDKYSYEDIHAPNWKPYHEYLLNGLDEEKQGNFALAVEFYQKAANIHPENSQLQYRLLYAEMKNIDKLNQVKFDIQMLAKLSGEYGPLKIVVDGKDIQIIGGGPNSPRKLKIINNNTFLDDDVVLKFEQDDKHNPTFLNCYLPDGNKPSFSKKSELSSQSMFSHTQESPTATEKENNSKVLVNRLKGG